ncbi:MAG TPA: hypothetical protein VFQ61_34770 [Polyangiaceae bacterium]|nr:hypothetical protein [Polyangiaceae bacterium]
MVQIGRSRIGVLAMALGVACSSSETEKTDETPLEVEQFLEDFHASRYSQASARAAALDAAAQANPEHGRIAFDRALAHDWHTAEWRRDPSQDANAIQTERQGLASLFQTAYEKNPDDPRVGCFLGLQLVGAGRALQQEQLMQQGFDVLKRAVDAWPEFNLFCLGIAYDRLPASDPDYALALKAALDNIEVCYGAKLDRENPNVDLTPYLAQRTSKGPKRACWNDPIAPHNGEGFFLWVGDLFVKQGNVAAARIAYNNVKLMPEYKGWPYRDVLEERLNSDLEAKSALYWDDDRDNDPTFAGDEVNRRCVICHAATADE